jgi:coenzyme F420-0:L-glutamate ligase/coenzyme F420-1:gamma-L-glutamate ligase
MSVEIWGIGGIGEVMPGTDVAALIADAAKERPLADGDVVVVTHKIVSKAEGQLVDLRTVTPSALAVRIAERFDKDARQVEVVLRESVRIVRMERTGADVAVIISDSFGRPWRNGIVNFAIGVAGMQPLTDYRGQTDPFGNDLRVTIIAVADELACASELVMGKVDNVPVAVIRGYPYDRADGTGRDLIMDPAKNLFH